MVLKFSRFPADSFEELSWVISWVFLSNFRERPWLACTPLFGLQRLLLRLADLADWLVRPVAPLVFSELLLLATHRLVIGRCMVMLVVAATHWMVLLVLVGVNFGSTPITSVAVALVVAILVTSTASATVFTLVDGSRIGIVMLVVA